MGSMVISLIDHSNNATALAPMGSMHLHRLHHHLVLGALVRSVVEGLGVLVVVDGLDSTCGLGPSH